MLKKRTHVEHPQLAKRSSIVPSIPADAALSFLKDTKAAVSWSARDLVATLKINRHEAEQVIAPLQAQGYVQPARRNGEWMTTPSGESVSGAKTPRFQRESVEQAIASLKGRIKEANRDPKTPFKINDAVAFGDFLLKEGARVQAADVGIRLSLPDGQASEFRSASGARAEREFLRRLRGRTALLSIRPYAEWMGNRSHLGLL
jgi:DNA-binding transcriptional MocR family regulator